MAPTQQRPTAPYREVSHRGRSSSRHARRTGVAVASAVLLAALAASAVPGANAAIVLPLLRGNFTKYAKPPALDVQRRYIPDQYILAFGAASGVGDAEGVMKLAALQFYNPDTGAPITTGKVAPAIRQVFDGLFPGMVVVCETAVLESLAALTSVQAIVADEYASVYDDGLAQTQEEDSTAAHHDSLRGPGAGRRQLPTQAAPVWNLDRIDETTLPLDGVYTYTNTGAGVRVYILDTGINMNHDEFRGGRAVRGKDYVTSGGSATDCHGHGTHVAGTVGGTTYGVAKGVTLVSMRVLDCAGSGAWSDVIAALGWVVADRSVVNKKKIVNMSLGGGGHVIMDAAVELTVAFGVVVVAAAGNNGANACNYSPSGAASAITVASCDSTDTRAASSNFGNCVDLFAPGVSVKSAGITTNSATATKSGTSMAAPHVAGVCAQIQQKYGGVTPAVLRGYLMGATTTGRIINTSGSPNNLLKAF